MDMFFHIRIVIVSYAHFIVIHKKVKYVFPYNFYKISPNPTKFEYIKHHIIFIYHTLYRIIKYYVCVMTAVEPIF